MITVTKLNRTKLIVNADLIEFVEKTPDTLITLTTGKKLMVVESPEEILLLVLDYRRKTTSHPVPVGHTDSPSRKSGWEKR